MKSSKLILAVGALAGASLLFSQCEDHLLLQDSSIEPARYGDGGGGGGSGPGGGGGSPGDESVGNNLSFPVIWAEGTEKALRIPPAGTPENGVLLTGSWWYVWGPEPIDPQSTIYSCDPTVAGESCYGATPPADLYKAYLQKDASNYWQAYNAAATGAVLVDSIDWGDNLESIDWGTVSQVRTEVVLYEVLPTPVLQYAMRHVSGWGTDEIHGLQTNLDGSVVYGPGTQATIFSSHARLTIQKLTATSPTLTWNATTHSWEGDANAPVFNMAVWEAQDGPGYYNAEVNVKGKIIYGYTWNLRRMNDGAGTYRLTFSFDNTAPNTSLNTFFDSNTAIMQPIEEEEILAAAETGGGGTAVLDVANNLTYIDVRITSGKSGGSKGGGKGLAK